MSYKQSIALIGLGGAGKTVFLTSLLTHLEYYDALKLQLTPNRSLAGRVFHKRDGEIDIKKFKLHGPEHPFARFEYERFRNSLTNSAQQAAEWPQKTKDTAHIACEFERSDWIEKVQLDFLDFPGERIADATMLDASFEEWSDHILTHLQSDQQLLDHAKEFLQLQGVADASGTSILQAYKLALIRQLVTFHALVTPSVFSLDVHGCQIRKKKNEDLDTTALQRVIGVSETQEFAPLSELHRTSNPQLCALFKNNYDQYKATVVQPLFSRLSHSDQLILLIDIVDILSCDLLKYNEALEVIRRVLYASANTSLPPMLASSLHWAQSFLPTRRRMMPNVERIALVATKADQVRRKDIERLRSLLKDMTKKIVKNYDQTTAFFTCAAVESTFPDPANEKVLRGYPVWKDERTKYPPPKLHDPTAVWEVSEVPVPWPGQWQPGEYVFPNVYPLMPLKRDEPPRQAGLNQILDFIMGVNFTETV